MKRVRKQEVESVLEWMVCTAREGPVPLRAGRRLGASLQRPWGAVLPTTKPSVNPSFCCLALVPAELSSGSVPPFASPAIPCSCQQSAISSAISAQFQHHPLPPARNSASE